MPAMTASDEKLLLARMEDAIRRAERGEGPCFLPFVSCEQTAFLKSRVSLPYDEGRLLFYGGYDEADYCCPGVFPSYLFYDETYHPEDDFPLSLIFAKGSGFRKLTHRDFLGSLMALGIKRETVGDILVTQDGFSAYIFCLSHTADYLLTAFTEAANDKIVCSLCDRRAVSLPEKQFETFGATVSSPRLDAVLSAALNLSRDEAERMIASGNVSVDHVECLEKAKQLSEGSLLSVRHHGRFLLESFGDRNRRDRLRITLRRYI